MYLLANTLFGTPFDAGAEKVVRLFQEGLSQTGAEAAVLSIRLPGSPEVAGSAQPKIDSANVYFPYPARHHPIASKIAFQALENYNPLAVRRLAATGALDAARVLFTHNLRGFSTGIWALQNRRRDLIRAHFIHDYQLICTNSAMMRGPKRCQRRCLNCRVLTQGRRMLSANVDIVYGASQYVLDRHLEEGFFPHAIARVVEPPLRLDSAPVAPGDRPIRRFGFFGRLVADKGIAQLLQAFGTFRDGLSTHERDAAELIVAGGGSGAFFDEMLRTIAATDGARYIGTMPPERYFPLIDALVVPSTWPDPNPFVVVEAYQFGKPVIGADVGGISRSVVDGQTGLHFSHDPANAGLSTALRRMWAGFVPNPERLRQMVLERDYNQAVSVFLCDVADHAARNGAAGEAGPVSGLTDGRRV